MKILFFADVHLGNYRYPIRHHITESMTQIIDIAEDENPDLILFAGDAFRTKTPATVDISDFGLFISRLRNVAHVVMIPGNHDVLGSGVSTIDVYDNYKNVRVVKSPEVITRDELQVVAIPWLPSKALSSFGLDGEDTAGAQRALLGLLRAKLDHRSSFLLAHATAFGTEYRDGVSSVLGNDVLWTNDLFDGFDLAVLGHIHKPQQITDNAYYVGSPCPVSFSETGMKEVLIWENGHVHHIALNTPEFVTIKASELRDYPGCFLKITKPAGDPDPEIPDCIWYEIISIPEEREVRIRLEDSEMTTIEAIRRWLELADEDPETIVDVLTLAKEMME